MQWRNNENAYQAYDDYHHIISCLKAYRKCGSVKAGGSWLAA
jgi:hypothetical protein